MSSLLCTESSTPVAMSMEDVLAGAIWVSSLTDPSLSLERLHETFMEVIFRFPDKMSGGNDSSQRRLRTTAVRERERRLKEELQNEERELRNEMNDMGHSYAEVDGDDFEESEDEDEQLVQDQEFLDWINTAQRAPTVTGTRSYPTPTKRAIGLELERLGLEDEPSEADVLPERLREIEVFERRPNLGPKTLEGGYTYEIPLENEAYWILRQLRNAGQPLAHNTRICALASHTLPEVRDEPVLISITFALQKITREYLEPSHLMIYHQTELHPLLCALLEDSELLKAAEHHLPVASYAYSTVTGRRQRPFVSDSYIGFGSRSTDSIGEGDAAWPNLTREDDYTQRKPCFIELGRLLVRILELDSLCHKLEHRRQQMLIMLKDNPEARVQDQRTLLDAIVFESSIEADVWHRFVQMLLDLSSRGAFHTVRALGLDDRFEEYSITGLQYQENLLANTPVNVCTSYSVEISLQEWADQVGSTLNPPRGGSYILSLFNNAIVDQFSKLPVLCRRVIESFHSEGLLLVTYPGVKRQDDIYPLSSFFVEHPQHYLDLLQLERQGKVDLHYVLDDALVRRLLNVNQLYQRQPLRDNDEWYLERDKAMELLVIHLVDSMIPKVKAELYMQARYQIDMICVRRLGILCAHGPYQRTELCLTAYDDDELAWDPAWNIVEALPITESRTLRLQSRVCGAYRGENSVTCFAFIDEDGRLMGSARWSDCALNSMHGRAAALAQSIQLEKLFATHAPTVIAVAANGFQSLILMRALQRLLKDRIYPALGVQIPLIWASPEIARFFSSTRFADIEASSIDLHMRTTIAFARYVQDPLHVLCALFDAKRTACRIFVGNTEVLHCGHEEQLYRRLSWEMSLWVGSTGFWLSDSDSVPHSVARLQFVPGLGPNKARRLHEKLSEGLPSSRIELREMLCELFGDAIATNAACAIRVPPPIDYAADSISSGANRWHLLDVTLIPCEWYALADFAATAVMATKSAHEEKGAGRSNGDGSRLVSLSLMTALIDLLENDTNLRRMIVHTYAQQEELLVQIRKERPVGWETLRGERELELILEELVAGGKSYQRRPYRRLSTRELMLCITGTVFLKEEEVKMFFKHQNSSTAAVDGSIFTDGNDALLLSNSVMSIVREGDYITGTVSGIRTGTAPGIRMTTSRGLDAFIYATDIADADLHAQFLQHAGFMERLHTAHRNGEPLSLADSTYETPLWLRRGSLLQGRVMRCNWTKCELQLCWCPLHEFTYPAAASQEGERGTTIPSYASVVRDAVNSVNSLKTTQLEKQGMVFSTKISRHLLFRDISNTRAQEWMREKEIGEVLLRPSSVNRNRAVCVVKLGSSCLGNWVIREDRRHDGSFFYRLRDSIADQRFEFDEIDEFLGNYIVPMVALVQGVRQHRRFVETVRDVPAALTDQHRAGRGFAYAFTEVGSTSKPPLYCVFTSGAGREYRFHLHFTNTSVYVRLPLYQALSPTRTRYVWVQCCNAEQVSQAIKQHATQN